MQEIEVQGETIPVQSMQTIAGKARYHERFIEYCFSIYATDAGRNVKAMMDIVEERHKIRIPQSSAYNWSSSGNWQSRGRELYHLLRKDIITDVMDSMLASAKEATAILDAMLKGKERPDATKVKIAFGLIDRVGLMPHSVVAEQIRLHVQERPASDVSSLSNEELQELEAGYVPSIEYMPEQEIPEAQLVLASQRRTTRQ